MSNEKKRLKVFLCHASDDKNIVRRLHKRLLKDGIDPWLDEEKLEPGVAWEVEIPNAVRSSNIVVVCISSNSINKKGYVQKEIKIALDVADEYPAGEIYIVPARLEPCDIPERLKKLQWVDLFNKKGYRLLLKTLNNQAEKLGFYVTPQKTPKQRKDEKEVNIQLPLPSEKPNNTSLEKFYQSDWVLRNLLVHHQTYWRHNRRRINAENLNYLNKYLAQHSASGSSSNLQVRLDVYRNHRIFLSTPNPVTGLINPDFFEVVNQLVERDYRLGYEIETNYTIADFLWDVETEDRKRGSDYMLRYIKVMFSKTFGQDFETIKLPKDIDMPKQYLKIESGNSRQSYTTYIAFESGRFTREDSLVAEILPFTVSKAFEETKNIFPVLCAVDVGKTIIDTANAIDIKIVLLGSLLKFFAQVDVEKKKGISPKRILEKFHYLFQEQNNPVSIGEGMKKIMATIRPI